MIRQISGPKRNAREAEKVRPRICSIAWLMFLIVATSISFITNPLWCEYAIPKLIFLISTLFMAVGSAACSLAYYLAYFRYVFANTKGWEWVKKRQ